MLFEVGKNRQQCRTVKTPDEVDTSEMILADRHNQLNGLSVCLSVCPPPWCVVEA